MFWNKKKFKDGKNAIVASDYPIIAYNYAEEKHKINPTKDGEYIGKGECCYRIAYFDCGKRVAMLVAGSQLAVRLMEIHNAPQYLIYEVRMMV